MYNNEVFGGINWSKNKDKVIFCAEKQETTDFKPYWESEIAVDSESKDKNEKRPENFYKVTLLYINEYLVHV